MEPRSLANLDDHLADVPCCLEVCVRGASLLEIEHAVHDRPQPGGGHEAAQVLGHRAAADQDADQALSSRDERERLELAAEAAADPADHCDRAADARSRQRALERVAPAYLEHQVDPATLRQLQYALVP